MLLRCDSELVVKTEIQDGLYIVVVAIALSYLLGAIAIALSKSMINSAQISRGF
mgnify:CR=1 FL=1